jgi:hypothetical protein
MPDISNEKKWTISILAGFMLLFMYITSGVFHKLRYDLPEILTFSTIYAIFTRIIME